MNALYWVGEARREVSDFMAVVKYGCAVDGLSGAGGKSRTIAAFAKVALEPGNGDEPPAGTMSVAAAVEIVYEKGRNQLTHGEVPGVLEDFNMARRVGDALLASLFYVVTLAVAEIVADEKSRVRGLEKKYAYRFLKARLGKRNQR